MYNEHSVIIYFWYGKEDNGPFYELCSKLDQLITDNNLGVYDGHEINMDNTDGTFFIYGPNAEEIFKAIKPTLDEVDFMRGATAVLKFGPGKEAPELELQL